MTAHVPIKLTASAQKKLPAALAARKARKAGGQAASIKSNVSKKKSRLDNIMKDIKMLNRRGTK